MPNAPEPDRGAATPGDEPGAEQAEEATEAYPLVPPDPETETVVINPDPGNQLDPNPESEQPERRFTAPGFDAKETAIIATAAEPVTEVFATSPGQAPPPGQPGAMPMVPVPQAPAPGRPAPVAAVPAPAPVVAPAVIPPAAPVGAPGMPFPPPPAAPGTFPAPYPAPAAAPGVAPAPYASPAAPGAATPAQPPYTMAPVGR